MKPLRKGEKPLGVNSRRITHAVKRAEPSPEGKIKLLRRRRTVCVTALMMGVVYNFLAHFCLLCRPSFTLSLPADSAHIRHHLPDLAEMTTISHSSLIFNDVRNAVRAGLDVMAGLA